MDRVLDERELCDLECLTLGAFQPLASYMTEVQYNDCLNTMIINGGDVFPMPIVLSMKSANVGDVLVLKNPTGVIHCRLTVAEVWTPDVALECEKVFGCFDDNHPYTKYLMSKGPVVYVSGPLEVVNTSFHTNFEAYRKSPAELRACGPWVGFQTRNPLHRSHIELIKKAAGVARILLHPVEGVTQECDIPFPVRMQCYKEVMPYLGDVTLSILPLSMRMAGPREAVWHAVIRRNYGCSHFIVGRDHAGPSYKKKDGTSFYDPLAAQQLAKSLETQIGIHILASEEVVYCDDVNQYMGISESKGHSVKNISGTQFRSMLENGAEVPSWYSYPKVVDALKLYYNKPRGSCFYFVGLSGSGKSTLAEALKARIEEAYPYKEVTLLDADIIRTHLSKGLGFSKEDRSMNVRRIGYVASEIVRHGGIVLVANIAPFEEDRSWNRRMVTQYGNYVEFFVDTPVEICEERDVKGLYKAARAGTLKNFTGVSDPFEVPTNAIVVPLMAKENSVEFITEYAMKFL
jgi:sulfate adenylyltransferase